MSKTFYVQMLGVIGLFFMMCSFQMKTKRKILFFQFLSGCFFSVHLFFMGALSGAVMNVIATGRSYVYYERERKKWHHKSMILYGFVTLFFLAGVFTYDGIYTLIPPLAMMVNSFSTWYGSARWIRIVGLLLCPFWFTYNLIVGTYPGMVNDLVMTTSILVGMFRYDLKKSSVNF